MLHTEIRTRSTGSGMPSVVRRWLSPVLCEALSCIDGEWEELHLRVGRCASVTVGGQNHPVAVTLEQEQMDALLVRLCEGSLYAHRDSINQGFLALEGGIRVGVCGRAFLESEGGRADVLAVRDVDALCIRFPHPLRHIGSRLEGVIRQGFPRGTLLYSPPGVGKTTLLRSLAHRFSSGPEALRTAVVDSRCEINDEGFDKTCQLCFLSGYPKGQGIEIAVRSMNAELVLCDELGNAQEADAILGAANCGVPVIATAHAADVGHPLRRPGFDVLHRAGVFAYYVGISRQLGSKDYDYCITQREEALTCG